MRHSLLALALPVLLLPLAAGATVTVKVNNTLQVLKFGKTECTSNTLASFAYDLGTAYNSALQTITIRASRKSDCSANTVDQTYTATSTTSPGFIQIPLSDFLFDLPSGCDADVPSSSANNAYLCVTISGTGTTTETGFAQVSYALTPPAAPIDLVGEGGNNLIRVTWAQGNTSDKIRNTDVYVVEAGAPLADGATPSVKEAVGNSATASATVDGAALVNGTDYDVFLRTRDDFGNVSDLSDFVTVSPVQVDDFYNHYRRQGGKSEGGGGCTSLGFGALGPLSLLGLFAFRRRARTRRAAGRTSRMRLRGPFLIGAATALAVLCTALPAFAQSPTSIARRAPRRLLFAAKFDKYDPQVDSEAALAGKSPYKDIFGDRVPWRGQFEGSVVVYHFYGSFLVGGVAGFWQNIGKGIETLTGKQSGDSSVLNIWNFGLVATYRFDWLADEVRWFPLVPYAQIGLCTALWSSKGGDGNVSDSTVPGAPGRGSGWTSGYTTALGLAFSIDAISPAIASEAYIEMGLQRTSLFVEFGWTRLDGFRDGTSLILSDKNIRFGLGLEF